MENIVFGPVPSRRLGNSLGINLIPSKICSLDCIYCEVGKTKGLTMKRAPYIPAREVMIAFDEVFSEVKDKTSVITITGAGEPTLNSDIDIIARYIKANTDIPLAILTNATTINDPEVTNVLNYFDIVVPSLDAGSQDVFENIDRPESSLNIEDIIYGLENFSYTYKGRLFLEILLVKDVNDSEKSINELIKASKRIKCEKIQLGTVFRPPAWEGVKKLSDEELEKVYMKFLQNGLVVEPVGAFSGRISIGKDSTEDLLKALLSMRPVTLKDITQGLLITDENAQSLLESVRKNTKVDVRVYEGEEFFSIS